MIKNALKTISYVLFTRRCELCGEVCEINKCRCEECESTKRITDAICKKCGREKAKCECEKDSFSHAYKAVAAPYYYKGSMERGVRRLKNYSFSELAPKMGEEIVKTVEMRYADIPFDCVTSVPLTKRKLKKRGYNQSELLAKEVAKGLGLNYAELLVKTRSTPSQRFSTARQRRVNLYDSFEVKKNADIIDKTILIVDDVKTTGSTLSECAKTLKICGAKAIYAAAFCITDKK